MSSRDEVIANEKLGEIFKDCPDEVFFHIYNDSVKVLQLLPPKEVPEFVQDCEDFALVWADVHKEDSLEKIVSTRDYRLVMTALCLLRFARRWRLFKHLFKYADVIDNIMKANELSFNDLHQKYQVLKKEADMSSNHKKIPTAIKAKPGDFVRSANGKFAPKMVSEKALEAERASRKEAVEKFNQEMSKPEADIGPVVEKHVDDFCAEVNATLKKEADDGIIHMGEVRVPDLFCDTVSATFKKESVNHPPHYQGKKFEAIDIIDDYDLSFSLGNALKYLLRCDSKGNAIEDLEKARWYLDREIAKRKA